MRKSWLYGLGGLAAVFGLTAMGPCSDLGQSHSYGQISSGAYSPQIVNAYDGLLQKYVDSRSFVHYRQWLSNAEDIAQLKTILDAMAHQDETALSPDQKKAFYINAYNAMTLDLILSHYDETLGGSDSPYPGQRSIRNIQNLDTDVWKNFQWVIAGRERSLDSIESDTLRPLGDARIHFSIVCASKGCPPLDPHALRGESVNTTLDQLADAFVNSGLRTTIDRVHHVIQTSQILDWYGDDFVKSFGSLSAFFSHYSHNQGDDLGSYSIQFSDYDWTLNESTEALPPSSSSDPSHGSGTEVRMGGAPDVSPSPTPSGSGTENLFTITPDSSPSPAPTHGSGTERSDLLRVSRPAPTDSCSPSPSPLPSHHGSGTERTPEL